MNYLSVNGRSSQADLLEAARGNDGYRIEPA
jgi:hypothetical protein